MTNTGKRLLFRQSKSISLTVIKGLLESDDIEIRLVDDLADVIPTALEYKPDVIVISGSNDETAMLSLCGKIRSDIALCVIPLLVLSDKPDENVRMAALRSGADDCLGAYRDATEIVLKLGNMLKFHRHRRTLAERNLFAMACEQVGSGVILIDGESHVIQANHIAQTEFDVAVDGDSTWIRQLSSRYTLCSESEWIEATSKSESSVLTMLEGVCSACDNNDGRRWFHCFCYPLVDDPEKRVLVTMTDVTKQLDMQDILLGVKRLISHKMVTPLNGIIGPLEIVLEDEADGNDRKKLIEMAVRSAEELANAVSRLEEYFLSPFTREDDELTKVDDLETIILQAASDLLVAGIEFDIKAPAKVLMPIGVHKMLAVFAELFENAIKFHPRHRPEMLIAAEMKNNKLHIDVIDDGCHIPPEALRFLHLPFYQASIGIAGETPGHGIGLSQVSRIIMAAGGTVRFANRTGCDGVCVSIILPVSSPKDSKKMSNADIFADNRNDK